MQKPPSSGSYSRLRATAGSTLVARTAGPPQPSAAATASTIDAPVIATGSAAETPTSCVCTRRTSATDRPSPTDSPVSSLGRRRHLQPPEHVEAGCPETDQESDRGSGHVRERDANHSRFETLHEQRVACSQFERDLADERRQTGGGDHNLFPLPRAACVAPQFHEEQNDQRGIDARQAAIGVHSWQSEPDRHRDRQGRRDDAHEQTRTTPALAGGRQKAERQHVPEEMIDTVVHPMSREQPPDFSGSNGGAVVLEMVRQRRTHVDKRRRERKKQRGARHAPRFWADHVQSSFPRVSIPTRCETRVGDPGGIEGRDP